MDKEHGGRVKVEGEFRRKTEAVGVSACGVVLIEAVAEDVRGIYADSPLNVAGELVYLIYRPVGIMTGRSHAHKREMATGR